MAASTVESAFVLHDRASANVRKIRREVRGLERDARKAGRALDDMADARVGREIDAAADRVRGLRDEVRGIPAPARGAERAMGGLDRQVVRSGQHARQTSTYYSMLSDRTKLLAGAAVAALPVVQALGGAVGALGGSLMGAGLGAGAVSLAGGGVLAAGLGSVVAVAKPAQKALEEATKAHEKYTEAVREHGKWSKEAAHAQRDLARTYEGNRGIQRATREVRALNREWRELTAPGRQEWFGLRGDLAQIGRRAAPRMAQNANRATGAVRRSGTRQARFLAGDLVQDELATFTDTFVRKLPSAERSLENVEVTMLRIAEASLPFFEEGVDWIEDMTGGWRRQTKDVEGLRRQIGGYVDDLKAWGHLTGAAFGLAHDVLSGGRPAGRSMVEDLTDTLDRWDDWVDRNPEKIDTFFRNAVQDTEDIADSVGDIVHGLNDMATELRPLIAPLTRLVSLFGDLSASLSPGAAMTMLLGVRGLRGSLARGGGGAAGAGTVAAGGAAGGGLMPMILGGGAAGGGARGGGGLTLRERSQRFMWQRQLAAQGALFGGPGLAGNAAAARVASRGLGGAALTGAGRVGGTAGRFALPAIAVGGLQGAFGPEGANQGDNWAEQGAWAIRNTAQGAAAIFGIANPVLGTDERTNRGMSRAQQFVSQLPGGQTPTAAQARRAGRELGPEIGRAEQAVANATFSGDRNTIAEELARLKALREQARAYRQIAKDAKHAGETERNERSRQHATELLDSFQGAFDTYSKKQGPDAAMDKTLAGVYQKMRGMNREGARILGENTLAWAREQARANPALQDEVDRLTRRIERSFSRMGDKVRIVNGRILTGSRTQWNSIADAIATPAERARQEVSTAFTALQEEAVGALEAMGYDRGDAKRIIQGAEDITRQTGGKVRGASAVNAAKGANAAGQRGAAQARAHNRGRRGDGIGNQGRSAVASQQRAQQASGAPAGPSLMGAKPGLGVYANEAAGFGLRVSSGARPGAVTSSGNRSFHASGDAIDLAGPPDAMMRFAQHAARAWGSHLEELIYTPLGGGQIKNGQPFVYGGQVAADHHDHVHLADTAPTAAGGGFSFPFSPDTAGPGLINLTAPTSALNGMPGAIANAAMGGMAAGLTNTVNDALGGGAGAPGGGDIASMLAAVGLPPIFQSIIGAESGGNANALNPSGASGWTQIMMPLHADLVARAAAMVGRPANVFDPMVNLMTAKLLYDQSGLSPWTASRPVWGGAQGDGIGRARLGSTAASGARVRVGGRGGTVVHFNPSISVNGADRAAMRAELKGQLDVFADMIVEEVFSGREDDDVAVMG